MKLFKQKSLIAALATAALLSASAHAEDNVRLIITNKTQTVQAAYGAPKYGNMSYAPSVKQDKTSTVIVKRDQVESEIERLSQSGNIVERDAVTYPLGHVTEPNYYETTAQSAGDGVPNDTYFQNQNYLMTNTEANPTGSQVTDVWEALGDQKVRPTIAVLDGGFLEEGRYDDMTPVKNISFMFGKYGQTGWNTTEESSCENGHGAGVYGVIGAVKNDGVGVAGIVDADMYMVKAMECGSGSLYDTAMAVRWAAGGQVSDLDVVDKTADIIHLSLGSEVVCPLYMQEAVDFAISQGSIVIAASGNRTTDVKNNAPSNCEGVISVGAVNNVTADISYYSNYGETLTISAQGDKIRSFANIRSDAGETTSKYGDWGGTSFAAPVVSGIYGLVKSHAPSVPNEVLHALATRTAKELTGVGCETYGCGAGIIDAKAFMDSALVFEEFGFGSVSSVLNDIEPCDQEAYLMSDGLKARLCSAYKFNLNPLYEGDNVTYKVFKSPKGEAVSVSNAEELIQTEKLEVILSDFDIETESFSYQVCTSGTCDSTKFYELTVDETELPVSCKE